MKLSVRSLVYVLSIAQLKAEGFVEEVSCSSDALTVMLNRNDPKLIEWMANASSQPVAYVYNHKERTPCGVALKSQNGLPVYNFTIPYGQACSVTLSNLEPDYQTAETTIAIEDNNDPEPSKNMRIHHVFCLYTRQVQTLRTNDIQTGHEVVASTGGKPKPKVALAFSNSDGRPLRAAKFGDTVKLTLALSPDQAYKAILPKQCMFSDRENMNEPGAKHLTFVQSECPVKELAEIVDPLQELNEEQYTTHFKTFRFGNQTTVYAHCTVQVCLTAAECEKGCFSKVLTSQVPLSNSSLNLQDVNGQRLERVRLGFTPRRRRRAVDSSNEVAITRSLAILDEDQTAEIAHMYDDAYESHYHQRSALHPSGNDYPVQRECTRRTSPASLSVVYVCLAILGAGCIAATATSLCLARKLSLKTKELETQTLCSTPTYANSYHAGVGSYLGGGARGLLDWASRATSSSSQYPQRNVSRVTGSNAQHLEPYSSSMRSVSEMSAPKMHWADNFSMQRAQ